MTQRMRTPPSRLQWRTIAVSGDDPVAFARDLESALQSLTDDGYNIVSQMPRDNAVIITANKAPTMVVTPTRRIDLPSKNIGSIDEEILVHYLDGGEYKQAKQESFIHALRTVKHALTASPLIVPVNIVQVTMKRFEPESFPSLFRMFDKDLRSQPE